MNFIQKYIKNNPVQFFFVVYNLGVFTWLQTNAAILTHGYSDKAIDSLKGVPSLVEQYIGIEPQTIQNLISQSPFRWLLLSLILSSVFSFVGKLLRFIIGCVLIGVSLYLIYIYGKTAGYL